MGRKGQIWSMDFTVSLMIFLTALFSVMFAWNYISLDTLETQTMKDMQLKALALSDSLIRTPGLPSDWGQGDVQVVGLAREENVLNATKVDYFVSMSIYDYDRLRGLMDIGFYDFYFEVSDINGAVYQNTTIPISNTSVIVVPIERYAVYNDRIVKVRFIMWT